MRNLLNWPNRVTLIRIVLIPLFLVVMLSRMPNWGPWLAVAIFTALAATDAVDGYLARSRNEVTTFGKLIDPLADKLLVTAALIALVEVGKLSAWLAMIIISREFIVTGLRMVAVAEGKVIAAGSFGKSKTVLQIVAIGMFIVKDSPYVPMVIGSVGEAAFDASAWVVMFVALALTIVSMIDYFYHARRILSGPWGESKG